MKEKFIARLVVYGLQDMNTKEYKRLLKWLEAKIKEAKKPEYRKEYSNKYVSKLIK